MESPARLTAHRPAAVVPGGKPRPRLPYCLHSGASLFREGDACTGLFEVASGVFRLSRLTRGGRRYVVGFGFPGDILGYGPESRHISDCEALTAARVIRHRPGILHGGAEPALQAALLNGALRQVEAMQNRCMIVGRNSALDRVASFLLLLGQRLGAPLGEHTQFELPMSRGDIADYLGLTVETISRSLSELRKAKLIEIRNVHQVVLLRPELLDALAEQEA